MWGTVLFIAFFAALDPVRVAVAALLVSWPRPMRNLLGYWFGAMVASIGTAVVALTLLRNLTPILTHRIDAIGASTTFHYFQIVVALVALPLAVVVAASYFTRRRAQVAAVVGEPLTEMPMQVQQPGAPAGLAWMSARIQNGVAARPFQTVFVAGVVSSIPPVEYLVIIAAILASGAATGIQLSAAVTFTIVSLAIIEIPLIACLAAPTKAHAVIERVQSWMIDYRRLIVAFLIGAGGVFSLASWII